MPEGWKRGRGTEKRIASASLELQDIRAGNSDPKWLPENYESACPYCGTCRDTYTTFWQRLWNVFFPRIKADA